MLAVLLVFVVDFMNFTYTVNPCPNNVKTPVVMHAGAASVVDPDDYSNGYDFKVDEVAEGSLAPGTRLAVVVLECDFLHAGGMASAYLFLERGGTAELLENVGQAAWGDDWGEPPSSIHIRFSNRFLYVDRCQDVNHCENGNYIVTTYAWRDGKAVKVYELKHKRQFR